MLGVFFYLPGYKAVYSALSLAACNSVNISVWQVNDGGQYAEATEEQCTTEKNSLLLSKRYPLAEI